MITPIFKSSSNVSCANDSGDLYPLSSNQQAVWLDQMLNPDVPFYNIGTAVQIDGDLQVPLLERALTEVVRENDALRLVLHPEDGLPQQRLLSPFEVSLDVVDFSRHAQPQQAAWDFIHTAFKRPFDFHEGLLWEWQVVHVSSKRHYILQRYHHLVADAWGASITGFLVVHKYNEMLRGEFAQTSCDTKNKSPSYLDFIAENQVYLASESFVRDKAFWSERFAQVPAGWVRPAHVSREVLPSEELLWPLKRTTFERISALVGEHGFSAAHFMMTLLGALVAQMSTLDEIVIGMPVHNRSTAEKKRTCGMFASMLPIRIKLDRDASFIELMRAVSQEMRQCYRHQRFPLAEICRPLNLRQNGRRQLFDITLSFESVPADGRLGDTVPKVIPLVNGFDQMPLSLFVRDYHKADDVLFDFTYNSGVFDRASVEKIRDRLSGLIEQLLEKIDTPIGQLSIIGTAEREQVLVGFNATAADYSDKLLHELFEEQAERTPNAVAVVSPLSPQTLTYGELDRRANQLAQYLRAQGVGADQPVAICMERSPEMIVGLLGILKAGGAYVPLDPVWPQERLAWVLADAAPHVVLTQARLRSVLSRAVGRAGSKKPPCLTPATPAPATPARSENAPYHEPHIIELDGDWSTIVGAGPRACPDLAAPVIPGSHGGLPLPTPRSLAYIIYTSGSTGQPKGVMVEHAQIANYIHSAIDAYELASGDRFLLFASISFDVAVEGIFGTLCSGASLVLRDDEALSGLPGLARVCAARGITVLGLPTAWWHRMMSDLDSGEGAWPAGVRLTIMGGEAASGRAYAIWKERVGAGTRLINVYGPTEATVAASRHLATGSEPGLTIGQPVANTRIYILDARRQPVPVGVAGEIYIGGAGVARGYLNQPELTAERFVPDPWERGRPARIVSLTNAGGTPALPGRMYKTGDLGRWRADGNIEYLGRNDFQVKLRGFRIEPGEIEARLLEHPAVREAVVLLREDQADEKRLVAYFTSNKPLLPEELRNHLRATLPDYMIPAAFVTLAALPLTPNGKVDRRALPAPAEDAVNHQHFEPPQGEVEARLAAIWADVLKLDRVGRHDSFFDLGGHSLLAVQVIEKLRQAGLSVDVRHLFGTPILSDLAQALTQGTDSAGQFIAPPNLIPQGCAAITPEMLPLVSLSAKEIATIVQTVPGGAANVQDIYPLAPLQEGILFHHLLSEQGDIYILPVLFAFETRAHLDDFLAALHQVIERHDALRSAVLWEALPRAVQVVYRHVDLPVEEVALKGSDPAAELKALLAPESLKMDLQHAPLLKVQIAADPGSRKWYALLQAHHLTLDHVSLEIVMSETFACLDGEAGRLLPPVPYRGFVAQALAQESTHDAEVFFRARLGDVDEPTLPFGLGDTHGVSHFSEASEVIAPELARRLRQSARQLGVSAAALFHAAWALVIARTSGRDDVVFGSVLSGRLQATAGADRIVGMFINTLPLRFKLVGQGVSAFVQATQRELVDLLSYEQTPLALAQRASGVAGSLPLFSALLNYRHSDEAGRTFKAAAHGISILGAQERTNYPFLLGVDDLRDGFVLSAQVDSRVAANRVTGYVRIALEALADALERAPEQQMLTLPILPAAERDELLYGFNATAVDYSGGLLHELFEEQAARTPDAVAVVSPLSLWERGGGEGDVAGPQHHGNLNLPSPQPSPRGRGSVHALTYGELDRRANQLAQHLRALGVGVEQPVAICMERSPELIIGLLGILKAGGAYVPLDPAYPPERIACMLADAAPRVVLTQARLRAVLPTTLAHVIELDGDWSMPVGAGFKPAQDEPERPNRAGLKPAPTNLAYIIYTSGSTGQPKGVMVEHQQVVNYVHASCREYEMSPRDRLLLFASVSFDMAVENIFCTLCSGATLVLRDDEAMSGLKGFARFCETQGITVLGLPTAWWHRMMSELDSDQGTWPAGVRLTVMGGEAASAHAYAIWKQKTPAHARLINIYGPTEVTVAATHYHADRTETAPSAQTTLTIGRPISNVQIYILDAHGEPVPVGVTGEIYVGGAGVARGYLNRPELTAERFVTDPFFPPGNAKLQLGEGGPSRQAGAWRSRMYKTGDLGRWRADGCIDCLGRNDFQVKLRGYRIEPGEIEARLLEHPAVREAVVLLREDQPGEKRLAAYVTAMPGEVLKPEELRAHLSATLPDYMLPAAFVTLAALPLTLNGKVDRRALPAPGGDAVAHQAYEPPQGEVEEALAAIWADVLKLDRVGRHDDFFSLGGHSLLAVQIIARVREAFGVDVPLSTVFQATTLSALAAMVCARQIERYEASDIERIRREIGQLSEEELRALLAQESEHE